ncbi:MAG: cell division protein ZapA [Rhizobiaceae bacterium]|nr:MAG: cell division protein ZapA [Rhizobiaceae bacterium]
MAQVVVTIDGKAYRMACEEGQESHLEGLADNFDRYVGHLKSQFGEIGDLERDVEALRQNRDGAAVVAEKSDQALAGMLSELTTQVRSIADKLNGTNPG